MLKRRLKRYWSVTGDHLLHMERGLIWYREGGKAEPGRDLPGSLPGSGCVTTQKGLAG